MNCLWSGIGSADAACQGGMNLAKRDCWKISAAAHFSEESLAVRSDLCRVVGSGESQIQLARALTRAVDGAFSAGSCAESMMKPCDVRKRWNPDNVQLRFANSGMVELAG
jgi:hypothetical protein